MSLVVNPYSYFTDTNGNALNGYLYVGEVGKNAENYPIAIFYDNLFTTPAPNPLTISAGYIYNGGTIAQIYASVDYSIVVKKTDGSLVYSSLNETGMTNGAIANIDEMKDFVAPYDNYALNVLGYSEAGDGGGGVFYYDANSTEDDNGGTIIEPTSGSGRWTRVYDFVKLEYFGVESPDYVLDSNWTWDATIDKSTANLGTIIDPSVALDAQGTGSGLGCMVRQYSGAANVKWFGAKGDGITDDTVAIQNSINYCKENSINLFISSGKHLITSSLTTYSSEAKPFNIYGVSSGIDNYDSDSSLVFERSTSLVAGADDITIMLVGGSGYYKQEIKNISFINPNSFTNVIGIQSGQISNINIEDVSFKDLHIGISFDKSIFLTLTRPNFTDCSIGLSLWNTSGSSPYVYNSTEFHMSCKIESPIFLDCNIGARISSMTGVMSNVTLGRIITTGISFGSSTHTSNWNMVKIDHIYTEHGGGSTSSTKWVDIETSGHFDIDTIHSADSSTVPIYSNNAGAVLNIGTIYGYRADSVGMVYNVLGEAKIGRVRGGVYPFNLSSKQLSNYYDEFTKAKVLKTNVTIGNSGNTEGLPTSYTLSSFGGRGGMVNLILRTTEVGVLKYNEYAVRATDVTTIVQQGTIMSITSVYNSSSGYYDIVVTNTAGYTGYIGLYTGQAISKPMSDYYS